MNERQQRLLQVFVHRFGYPGDWGGYYICVKARGVDRREYPKRAKIYPEILVRILYEMDKEGLLELLSDRRQGTHFDGKFGSSPGWAPGDPTDYICVILSEEALKWLGWPNPPLPPT